MPAPAAVHIHGAADAVNDIQDEENLDVQEFKAKYSRETRDRKNRHGNLRRREYFNFLGAISLTAFIVNVGGLADKEPGTKINALVNYAATRHGLDPSVGTLMLDDAEDTLSLEEDLKTSYNITHAPFVLAA